MFIFILSLYSFIISYYAFDLLEFIILFLSKKFSLDLMLTQLEDLTIIIFDLVNYSLLVLIIPFLFIQLYFFFAPAFYGKEKKIVLAFLIIFLLSGFFSLFLAYISLVSIRIERIYIYKFPDLYAGLKKKNVVSPSSFHISLSSS